MKIWIVVLIILGGFTSKLLACAEESSISNDLAKTHPHCHLVGHFYVPETFPVRMSTQVVQKEAKMADSESDSNSLEDQFIIDGDFGSSRFRYKRPAEAN